MNERARQRREIAQAQAEREAMQRRLGELENQVAQQREQNSRLSAELERLREEQRRAAPANPEPAHSTVFSFLLLPSVRAGSEQQTLKLPPGAAEVQLRMTVGRGDYRRYRASLRSVDGGAEWQAPVVKASRGKDATTVAVTMPAGKFTSGDYILTLTGVDAGGATEEINRYSFRVNR